MNLANTSGIAHDCRKAKCPRKNAVRFAARIRPHHSVDASFSNEQTGKNLTALNRSVCDRRFLAASVENQQQCRADNTQNYVVLAYE